MDKITYLAQLAEGLARWVPERERQEILRYYAEYFEEAGPQREADVVAELGDPWALSSRLAIEGGYVTQEQASSWTPPRKKRKIWPIVLGVAGVMAAVVVMAFTAMFNYAGRLIRNFIPNRAYSEAVVDEVTTWDNEAEQWTYIEQGTDGVGTLLEPESFQSVEVDISIGDVTIYAGNDFYLELKDDAALGCFLGYKVEDGVLKVYNTDDNVFELPGKPRYSSQVVLNIPEGYGLDEVQITTGAGDVVLEGVTAQKLTVDTKLGAVDCTAQNLQKVKLNSGLGDVTLYTDTYIEKKMELSSGMGDVNLYGYPAPDMKVSTSMGDVQASLYGCSIEDCSTDLSSGMGAVSVNGQNYGSSAAINRNGDSLYALEASSGMGEVSLYFE